jgi:hypothetical protein
MYAKSKQDAMIDVLYYSHMFCLQHDRMVDCRVSILIEQFLRDFILIYILLQLCSFVDISLHSIY